MRAILHIGTEKTGTTSSQNFLHENRTRLLSQDIVYPSNLGGINHRFIASYALQLDTADESMRAMGLHTQQQIDNFHSDTEARLTEQLTAASTARYCIISSEHLHSRLRTEEQVLSIKQLLAPLFEDIEVHIHLRPQVDVAISLASTQSRVGGRIGEAFFQSVRADQIYYNYDRLVGLWEGVFGVENVRCLAFKETPSYLDWLAQYIGLDLKSLPTPKRTNEALDVNVMALVNALVDSGKQQRVDFRVLDRLPVSEKLTLDQKFARQIQHRFEESNRSLISRRDDLREGQLQPNWGKFPETGNTAVLEQKCNFAGALSDLVSHYNNVIAELTKKSPHPGG
ncbi:Methyltransferase FkbM family [Sulfitobacter noctilucicola]|uniref:Sulfotransferase family protein n=1 Tax=Sulfitobacter noctilucicola TaxID=1342301 RepID=A0A7W6Q526_9RHOB|nr:hypothetical protein [Sulfitobacter noctilucicola]KIN63924.1 Methyltransferase FkbM family [Sulfitobacter noctilucicola]MBB4175283.1 hypothetical protein [Sulfitobacter noctilucicola]